MHYFLEQKCNVGGRDRGGGTSSHSTFQDRKRTGSMRDMSKHMTSAMAIMYEAQALACKSALKSTFCQEYKKKQKNQEPFGCSGAWRELAHSALPASGSQPACIDSHGVKFRHVAKSNIN